MSLSKGFAGFYSKELAFILVVFTGFASYSANASHSQTHAFTQSIHFLEDLLSGLGTDKGDLVRGADHSLEKCTRFLRNNSIS